MKKIVKTTTVGGRDLTLEIGQIANQADAAVLARYGDTVLLAAVTSKELEEDRGYFPLSVDYQERLYAGGRIKGSRWVKREGRPTDEEILTARVIDRSIRPLFPKGLNKDVQVIVTVLSVDHENDPKHIAGLAVSAAIEASPLPWYGPVSILNVGEDNKGKLITSPKVADESNLDIIVSNTKDAIVMIEAGAHEATEEQVLKAVEHAQKESKKLLTFIEKFAKEVGNTKVAVEDPKIDDKILAKVKKASAKRLIPAIKEMANVESGRSSDFYDLKKEIMETFEEEEDQKAAGEAIEYLKKTHIRAEIMKGNRPDGRKHDVIRQLSSEVGLLPRTHGSALFQRGATQALNIATIADPSLAQLLETVEGEEEKRYMHNYVMPPYSVGETGRVGFAGRREIGHGALAERALMPVIPSVEEFPYAMRLVSEVTSSNGSTSMAATCSSTLSLMDAGVPIKSPVSGIAMGLIIEKGKVAILSDIAGIEDFNGDMDFKIAGTAKGITAMQLDVKTLELTLPILKKAVAQAKKGRAHILESMLKTISEPRKTVSVHAPKIKTTQIKPEKIGEIIGPGGKTIKGIIATTGANVDVSDDGTINISAIDEAAVDAALKTIEDMTKEILPGEIYDGEVKRIENFGAFVNILPGRDGMVHISDMSEGFVNDTKDVVSLGDKVTVRVKEIDNMGRINLSMILDPSKDTPKKESEGRGRGSRDDRRGGRDRGKGRNFDNKRGDKRNSGPHFPASRLVSDNKKRY